MQIRVNVELFERLKHINANISLLNNIIQNDIEISEEEFQEWKGRVAAEVKELWGWHLDVEKWVKGPVA